MKQFQRRMLNGALLLCIFAVGFSILLPYLNRARVPGGYIRCPSRMRQLGQAVLLYAQAHDKHLPDTIEDLLLVDDFELSTEIFCCPSSSDEKALGDTPQQKIAAMRAAGIPANLDDKA